MVSHTAESFQRLKFSKNQASKDIFIFSKTLVIFTTKYCMKLLNSDFQNFALFKIYEN